MEKTGGNGENGGNRGEKNQIERSAPAKHANHAKVQQSVPGASSTEEHRDRREINDAVTWGSWRPWRSSVQVILTERLSDGKFEADRVLLTPDRFSPFSSVSRVSRAISSQGLSRMVDHGRPRTPASPSEKSERRCESPPSAVVPTLQSGSGGLLRRTGRDLRLLRLVEAARGDSRHARPFKPWSAFRRTGPDRDRSECREARPPCSARPGRGARVRP